MLITGLNGSKLTSDVTDDGYFAKLKLIFLIKLRLKRTNIFIQLCVMIVRLKIA